MIGKRFIRIRGTTRGVDGAALELRSRLTQAEEILWNSLRGRSLGGVKFRRQHPVGRFVLDFYCAEYRLVIELDGESHLEQKEYDAIRSEHLANNGYHVIRFDNDEVLTNLPGVLDCIANTIKTLFPYPPPRPELGEGDGG